MQEFAIPPLVIEPSHGSVALSGLKDGAVSIFDRGVPVWQGNVSTDGSTVVGFLEPNHNYDLKFFDGVVQSSTSFATEESPFAWNQTGDAFRPGSVLHAGDACTAGFLLRDALNDTIYVLTAGHCYEPHTIVRTKGNQVVGQVIASHHDGALDYGLIAVSPAYRQALSPSMSHWTGPASASQHTIRTHDPICIYGHGNGFHVVDQTRARCGEFWTNNIETHGGRDIGVWQAQFQANFGDSGSGVIDYNTGVALGILIAGTPGALAAGIDICSILSAAKDLDGFELRVVEAPYKQASMTYPPLPLPPLFSAARPMTLPCE